MADIDVADFDGQRVAVSVTNPGRASAAASKPAVLSTEDFAALTAIRDKIIAAPATEAKQDSIIAAIEAIPGGGSGGDASAANQVTMIGHLDGIENALGGTLTVSGTVGISGTVPVSGPLTDTQLRASALAVTGEFYPETQPVSGTVGVSGSVAVTGTFWQATQPVSAASLPLPAGASTSAKQDEAKASLDKLSSAKRWFAITPADTALASIPDAIYVGGDGNLVLRGDDDADATFAVVAGQILPVSPAQVRADTTATGLIGLVA